MYTQVIASVLSLGDESASDLMGMVAASAAVSISDIPFNGPVGAVRVGFIDGKLCINPGFKEIAASALNLVVAGTADAIMMVEGGASELTEEQMLEALALAHGEIKKIVKLQQDLAAKVGMPKRTVKVVEIDKDLEKEVAALAIFLDRLKGGREQACRCLTSSWTKPSKSLARANRIAGWSGRKV